jgi:hypothetical protein
MYLGMLGGTFNADFGSAGPNDMLFQQAGIPPHFHISVPANKLYNYQGKCSVEISKMF